jgi:hypothetical protein
MKRDERQQLRAITDEVPGWIEVASVFRSQPAEVAKAAVAAKTALRDAVIEVRRSGQDRSNRATLRQMGLEAA